MQFTISFPGGVAVDAHYRGHTVRTDQPKPLGEDGAMSPFDLFLASIATCMGFYALRFCQERELPTDGLNLTLEPVREEKRLAKLRIELTLPKEFPEKYRAAILRAVDQCAVKRAVHAPPEFVIDLV